MNQEISKNSIGEAGEYYIASQATLRGWSASMQRHNHNGSDVLISREEELKARWLQVKTSRRASQFRLSKKDEHSKFVPCREFFYVFVVLDGAGTFGATYIVPAKFVAETIYSGHRAWVAAGGKDSDIRCIKAADVQQYKEAWHLLG